ncbi:MAG: deoxyuridine 5'-triphosphate nucleotidohydrolase [Acidilobaceae archaeon]
MVSPLMVLPGHEAREYIDRVDLDSIQPAGIDLSICEVNIIEEPGHLGIKDRIIPKPKLLELREGLWHLPRGAYRIRYCEAVKVPEDTIGLCFPRSSLLRMGVDVKCAVWDPGYHGRGEGLLIVYNESGVTIEHKAKIAQIIFIKLKGKPHKLYEGVYQKEGL